MKTSKTPTDPLLTAVRWTARISSLLFIGVFILMFIGEGFDPTKITRLEWASLFFFPFGLVIGMIFAWWREGLGGAITAVSVLASLFVTHPSSSRVMYMLLFASPGFLFLLCWSLSKTAKAAEIPVYKGDVAQPSSLLSPNAEVIESRKA